MKNYTQVPNELIRTSELSAVAKCLYSVLLSFNPSHPSLPVLCKMLGLSSSSTKTVKKALKELVDREMVSYIRGSKKSKKANQYFVETDSSKWKLRNARSINPGSANPVSTEKADDTGSTSPVYTGSTDPSNNTKSNTNLTSGYTTSYSTSYGHHLRDEPFSSLGNTVSTLAEDKVQNTEELPAVETKLFLTPPVVTSDIVDSIVGSSSTPEEIINQLSKYCILDKQATFSRLRFIGESKPEVIETVVDYLEKNAI